MNKDDYQIYLDDPSKEDLEYHKEFQKDVYDIEQVKKYANQFKELLKKTPDPDGWSTLIKAAMAGQINSPVYVIENYYILEAFMEYKVDGLEEAWGDFVHSLAGYDLEKFEKHVQSIL